jgi:hypothetical protein
MNRQAFTDKIADFLKTALCAVLLVGGIVGYARAVPSVTLAVPSSMLNSQIYGGSGTQYFPNAAGQITVTSPLDAKAFQSIGFTTIVPGSTPTRLALVTATNANGSVLVASSAAAGNFLIAVTPGTSEALTGEAATGATKTDAALVEMVLPATYVAGNNLTITVNANYSGSGVAGTATVAAAAYAVADAGTQSATLVTTAAQAITTTNAAYAFTVNGATLTAGMRLMVKLTTVMQETGGTSSLTAQITAASIG